MSVLRGEHVRMRVFLGESDHWRGQPLYRALLELFRGEHLAGATVLRAIAGFGASSRLHTTQLLRLSQDQPMVIEVVDTQENIDRILPRLESMLSGGLVTLENVRVVRYAPSRGSHDGDNQDGDNQDGDSQDSDSHGGDHEPEA